MIWNLLSNAVKFTPTGGTVTVRRDGQAATVRLSDVADIGPEDDSGLGFLPLEDFKLKRTNEELFKGDESMMNVWQLDSVADSSRRVLGRRYQLMVLQSSKHFYSRQYVASLSSKKYPVVDVRSFYDSLPTPLRVQATQNALSIARTASGNVLRGTLRIETSTVPHRMDLLHADGFVPRLEATTRAEAIHALAQPAAAAAGLEPSAVAAAVLSRERIMSTGIGHEVAVPHARIDGLKKPVLVLGHSPKGVDFDSPDGEPARRICLLLTPREDLTAQLQIIGQVARTFKAPEARRVVYESSSIDVVRALVKTVAGESPHGEALPGS